MTTQEETYKVIKRIPFKEVEARIGQAMRTLATNDYKNENIHRYDQKNAFDRVIRESGWTMNDFTKERNKQWER
jgi:hypothetical protein